MRQKFLTYILRSYLRENDFSTETDPFYLKFENQNTFVKMNLNSKLFFNKRLP